MIMNFVYLQKKWEGCAKNTWLTVDYEEKTYRKAVTPFCDISKSNTYEFTRKIDIDDMISELVKNGFTEK